MLGISTRTALGPFHYLSEFGTNHLLVLQEAGDNRNEHIWCRIRCDETRMEILRSIRYKLRMMGVPLLGPSYIYDDNMSVVHNTQRPESKLKKKSNSVCYHAVREAVAMGECLVGHVSSHDNPADICTKLIPGGRKRDHLIGLILNLEQIIQVNLYMISWITNDSPLPEVCGFPGFPAMY